MGGSERRQGTTTDGKPPLLVWLLVGLALAIAAMEWMLVTFKTKDALGDFEIYRGAIRLWFSGGDLYDYAYASPLRPEGFPFTYPPFAAIVLAPLMALPNLIADHLWTIANFVLVVAMTAFVILRAPRDSSTWLGELPSVARRVGLVAAGTIAMLLTQPFIHNVALGQVSLVIAALVLFDVGGLVPRRFQGVLVGLAGAIKLTPLVVIPYFLVTRQWRQALVASATFAVATALAFAVNPGGSVTYWGTKLLDTSRVGDPAAMQNKSILGLLDRWDIAGSGQRVLWIAVAVAILVIALVQSRRQFANGRLVGAALIMGCASVAVSPISWPHHQSWSVLVAVWLLLQRRALFMALGAALVLINLAWSPLMGLEFLDEAQNAPLLLRLGRELPTLSFAVVCILGLPLRKPVT